MLIHPWVARAQCSRPPRYLGGNAGRAFTFSRLWISPGPPPDRLFIHAQFVTAIESRTEVHAAFARWLEEGGATDIDVDVCFRRYEVEEQAASIVEALLSTPPPSLGDTSLYLHTVGDDHHQLMRDGVRGERPQLVATIEAPRELAERIAALLEGDARGPVTVEYDPDDARGCIECPLFAGVPRDGVCMGLGGRTLNFGEGGRFVAAHDCPLRDRGVLVRRPA